MLSGVCMLGARYQIPGCGGDPSTIPAQVIKKQLAEGVSTRRVGLVSTGAPARQHSDITTPDGEKACPTSNTQPFRWT